MSVYTPPQPDALALTLVEAYDPPAPEAITITLSASESDPDNGDGNGESNGGDAGGDNGTANGNGNAGSSNTQEIFPMNVQYVHEGDAIDYRPSEDTPSGSVIVLNELVGVTKRPLKAGELGSLHVVGVFAFPKATGSDTAIAKGAQTYWDADNARATTESSGNVALGKATVEAGDDQDTVEVRLAP